MKNLKEINEIRFRKYNFFNKLSENSNSNILDSKIEENKYGNFQIFKNITKIPSNKEVKSKSLIENELKLVEGISDKLKIKYQSENINSLKDLLKTNKYNKSINELNSILEIKDYLKLFDIIKNRLGSSSYLLSIPVFLSDEKKLIYFDIETVGFSDCPAFVIGIGYINNSEELITEILFLNRPVYEKAMLYYVLDKLKDYSYVITYNGKSFDLPFLLKRFERYELIYTNHLKHLDLYHIYKFNYKIKVANFKLKTLEFNVLNIKRENDIQSEFIPLAYQDYLSNNNYDVINNIINHNLQDIHSTFFLYKYLENEDLFTN